MHFEYPLQNSDWSAAAVWSPVPDEWDAQTFERLTTTQLDPDQVERITRPAECYPRQEEVLAVHWHPEFVPGELIEQRAAALFPAARDVLIIPTEHNVLHEWQGTCGVEIDCYSASFARKVQLLAHFAAPRLARADRFRRLLDETYAYRATQLDELLVSLSAPDRIDRRVEAAGRCGAEDELVAFVERASARLAALLEDRRAETAPAMCNNRLVRAWFESLRERWDDRLITRALLLLREVKRLVKQAFAPERFQPTEEIIAEIRGLGGAVVIPHPEQFWPILLAGYDVDGIEVWNPRSREYTEFLIDWVSEHNAAQRGRRPLLVLMGDDCHMGELVVDPARQDPEKSGRELGVQPGWDDPAIRARLAAAGMSRGRSIAEYRARLSL